MQLRTYRANSIAEALAAVKRDLGPDALVVHTRSRKVGGVLGVGAREEIEILASPPPAPPHARPAKPQPTQQHAGRAAALRLAAAYTAPAREPAPAPAPAPKLTLRDPAADDRVEVLQVRQRRTAVEPPAVAEPRANSTDLHAEVGALKQMVSQLLASGAAPAPGAPILADDPLADWYARLIAGAVSRELAERIVADVRRASPARPDATALRRAFLERIARCIPVGTEQPSLPGPPDPRPRTIALVGATGVGKTTTVAKIAAQAKLASGARVGVITCDTNRIGAIEQLRTYAQVLGVAFRAAGSPHEMASARQSMSDTDLLVIDTPGLSPKDEAGVAALAAVLRAGAPDEVHLALPASGAESALLGACRAFEPLGPSRLLFTKLDEAVTYGVILSVASTLKTELSYLTTGPRIPEQIERPDPQRLAELIAA